MAIDVFAEEIITMKQAANRLPKPRGTKPIHASTMWRWTTVGLKSENGEFVRLETVRIGGTRCTSIEALRRFFERLQAQEGPGTQHACRESPHGVTSIDGAMPVRSTGERRRHQEEAARSLDFAFFGCDRVIEESGYGKETLLQVFDCLVQKLPTARGNVTRAYDSVRRAVFKRAVELLQSAKGVPQGLKAAKDWIKSLDLKMMDVRQLSGCGSHTEREWKEMIQQGVIDVILRESAEGGVK